MGEALEEGKCEKIGWENEKLCGQAGGILRQVERIRFVNLESGITLL